MPDRRTIRAFIALPERILDALPRDRCVSDKDVFGKDKRYPLIDQWRLDDPGHSAESEELKSERHLETKWREIKSNSRQKYCEYLARSHHDYSRSKKSLVA